jgi:mono/diheme cytochrome c family protein
VIAALLPIAITLTIGWRPFLGPRTRELTDRKFERTPERMARGKYLVEGVSPCMGCHSPHDWTKHDAPVLAGMIGAGQDMSVFDKGLPGHIVAPNLTPDPETGAGNWSDDMLARAIREGIGHDGRTLFPMMPYGNFRAYSDEDLASIVVYLRSLAPVRNPLHKTEIIFPVKYLIRGVPQPITAPVSPPDLSTTLKRGAFLIKVASCADCHTPQIQGQVVPGMDYAGGFVLDGPWGYVAAANLTPDPTGIPYYDETLFLQTMRTGYVKARELKQVMPWQGYRNMTDEDLKAIFAYLKTVKPVRHRVDNSEPPTMCPLCKVAHGAGDQNKVD